MLKKSDKTEAICGGCVYFPANLPAKAYSAEDWAMLQSKSCSFDLKPGDNDCQSTRKTHCSLIDLQKLQSMNL